MIIKRSFSKASQKVVAQEFINIVCDNIDRNVRTMRVEVYLLGSLSTFNLINYIMMTKLSPIKQLSSEDALLASI